MKVVINKCYGGFGLSPLACKEFAKLKGKKCYFFNFDFNQKKYVPLTMKEAKINLFFNVFTVKNPNDYKCEKEWNEMTLEEKQKQNKLFDEFSMREHDIDRADVDLIKVVEKLGKKANSSFANLEIIDIPDDIEYNIEEYDGQEWISEKHRTWS